MNWKSVSATVGKFAPVVGTALGGPAGAAIGTMVAAALGVADSPDAVDLAIKNDPQAALKLREFELANDQHIRDHIFKTLAAELQDVQNAREIHKLSRMPAVITVILSALNTLFGMALFFVEFPDTNRDMINNFGGQLVLLWVGSITYWIGTTRSSAEKTRLIGPPQPHV